jgi:hypothetical protein
MCTPNFNFFTWIKELFTKNPNEKCKKESKISISTCTIKIDPSTDIIIDTGHDNPVIETDWEILKDD